MSSSSASPLQLAQDSPTTRAWYYRFFPRRSHENPIENDNNSRIDSRIYLVEDSDEENNRLWSLERFWKNTSKTPLLRFYRHLLLTTLIPFTAYSIVADAMQWEDRRKNSPGQWLNEFGNVVFFISFLWIVNGDPDNTRGKHTERFGGLERDTVTIQREIHWTSALVACMTCVIWGAIGEHLQHSLMDIKKWPAILWVLIVVMVLMFVVGIWANARIALRRKELATYLIRPISLVLLGSLSVTAVWIVQNTHLPLETPQTKIHVHHYLLLGLLSLFFPYNTWHSRLLYGVCIGGAVQGVVAYGLDPVLEEGWKPTCSTGWYSCQCRTVSCGCVDSSHRGEPNVWPTDPSIGNLSLTNWFH